MVLARHHEQLRASSESIGAVVESTRLGLASGSSGGTRRAELLLLLHWQGLAVGPIAQLAVVVVMVSIGRVTQNMGDGHCRHDVVHDGCVVHDGSRLQKETQNAEGGGKRRRRGWGLTRGLKAVRASREAAGGKRR